MSFCRLVFCALFLLPQSGWAGEVTIFAAASVKAPLDALFSGDDDVRLSYGGSGGLARQVLLGAPADIVVLAHPQWMQALVDAGAVQTASRQLVAGNSLVLIGAAGADPVPLTAGAMDAALGSGRIATGFVDAVPAGQYAREALQAMDLWDELATRLAETDNVSAALTFVARGETPLGIVYASDAFAEPRVSVLATFPADAHSTIIYEGALTADAAEGAMAVLARITGPEGQETFRNAGFAPAPSP